MIDFHEIFTPGGLISLITLSLMEIVLGIDNIIFIAIVSSRLPHKKQAQARAIGLSVALFFRICLLFSISWIIGLREALFYVSDFGVTGRDLILFCGGLFLVIKTCSEIYQKIYKPHAAPAGKEGLISVRSAILQIIFLDVIFSFDSILTAVGLIRNVLIMVLAVVLSMLAMLAFSGSVSDFINRHPTVKMLALVFLVVIGGALVAESLHLHVEKGYIYSALLFSVIVEMLNMAYRSNAHKRNQ